MNHPLRLISAVTLPLLFTVGCASTDSKPFADLSSDSNQPAITAHDEQAVQSEQVDVNEAVKLAINNMDGYLNRMEQDQVQEKEQAIETDVQTLTEVNEEPTDMTVLIVEDEMVFEEASMMLTAQESEEIDQIIALENSSDSAPEQTKFFFGFNKTQLSDEDKDVLNKHAEYLLNNKDVVLVISGHADNRGNKNYNQYLSLLRAESIAAILTAAGVPEGQLRVSGMGDNIPMVDATHWGENRRAELLYRDALMLSSQ